MNRRALLMVAVVAFTGLLSNCGSGSGSGSGGNTGQIAITTAPPASVDLNQSASVAATVTNESQDAGVDWTCSPSPCGAFVPAHTTSGGTTVWTASSTPETVTITAASTSQPSVIATAKVIVNPVTVTISRPPPSHIDLSQTASIAATVANDSLAGGVDWTCTPAPCGSFNPTHTASGVITVWTAPATPGTVTIQAASTSVPTVTATAMVVVNPITITITTAPPAIVEIDQTASMAATVMNDNLNGGVDWTCTPAPCGAFVPAHTTSGGTTVWTAPSSAGTITIQAASTSAPTVTTTAMVTVDLVTISITTAPPASIEINQSAPVAATVTDDGLNGGVDWTCTPSPCGSFNPGHTASGATSVWTAPSTPGSVTITATATSAPTATATAMVTVNPIATAASLSGQFAFYISGYDSVGDFYAAAGSVTLDGNGNVTLGEEDLNNTSYTTAVKGDALTGTYTVGNDGQGEMVLTAKASGVADPLVGASGVQTLAFTVVNANHLLITEFDAADTSSGSMDLQTGSAITAGIAGNFAMTVGGFFGGQPALVGAVYTATAGTPGTLAATNTADSDIGGTTVVGGTAGGTYSAADSNGRGTLTFGVGASTGAFTYYIVGAEAFYLVETDTGGVMVGASYGQGVGTFSAASIASTNVIDEPLGEAVSGPLALAGEFTSNGTTFTGVTDYNEGGNVPLGPGPDTLSATYTIAANGYGSMTAAVSGNSDFVTYGIYAIDPALNLNDPNNTSGGGGALIAELDPNDIGSGFIVSQTATAIVTVNEASGFAGQVFPSEYVNATGQLVFGASSFAGTTSVNDFNLSVVPPTYTQTTGEAISGVIVADTTNVGRYTVVVTTGAVTNNRVSYVANGGLAVDVDVDASTTGGLVEVGSGIEEGQQ
jgi:hypothetical protein